MKPATDLIHAGEVSPMPANPLTTPIYETTTFVFDSAQEVIAYNEGRSAKYLYSRYGNPTAISVEQKVAALDRAEAALVFSSGMGATTTILMAHARAAIIEDPRVVQIVSLEARVLPGERDTVQLDIEIEIISQPNPLNLVFDINLGAA